MKREDHKLWKKVAATVNPIDPARTLTAREFTELRAEIANKNVRPTLSAATPPPKPVIPRQSTTLDLHGMTLTEAHRATLDFIDASGSHRKLTIITGKSGQIKAEFTHWLEGIPKVHSVKAKCDGGAYTVRILKSFR
jgi:DNA-nicking Smr family endonuclease